MPQALVRYQDLAISHLRDRRRIIQHERSTYLTQDSCLQ